MIDGLKNDIMINKVNTNMMKMKTILFAIALLFSFGGKVIAQNDCAITLSLFAEPAKVKNYEAALPHYAKVVKECPTYSMATYQYAAKMFEYFVEKGDKSKVADLEQAYKYRMQYYPSKTKAGDVMSKIAQVKFDNAIGSKMDQFKAFDEAFKKDEASFTSPKSIYTYFSLAVDLFKSGEMDIQDVFDLYDTIIAKIESEESRLAKKLTDLLDKQDSGAQLSQKENKRLKAYEKNLGAYSTVKGSVDGKLGQLADCPNLIPLYNKDFDSKKDDIDWIKRAAGRMSAKDCTDDPLFLRLVEQLDRLAPSAETKLYLSQLEKGKGNTTKQIAYLEESLSLQQDPLKKAKVAYRIGEVHRVKGSYGRARSSYMEALQHNPSMGICYLKIANMIGSSANSCGNTVFEKRAVNWKAAAMAEKAARVDASIAGNARAAAASFRARAPQKSDIFSEGMAGKTVSFSNCWVGGSITVPNL